jgi:hypothetical protein
MTSRKRFADSWNSSGLERVDEAISSTPPQLPAPPALSVRLLTHVKGVIS